MNRIRNAFTKPFPQILLVMSIAFILYLFASRPKGEINDLAISGQYAYLANGLGGIRVVDISAPENLAEVNFLRCSSPFSRFGDRTNNFINCMNRAQSLSIQDNLLFVVDRRSGLWVFDLQPDPANPTFLGQLKLTGRPQSIAVSGDTAYVASGRAGIRVIKLKLEPANLDSSPPQPAKAALTDLEYKGLQDIGNVTAVYINGNFLYWIERDNILHISSLKNKNQPAEVFTQEYDYPINHISFYDHYALVTAGKTGLVVFNNLDPQQFTQIANLAIGGSSNGIYTQGNNAYITAEDVGLAVVDITHIETPRLIQKSWYVEGNPDQVILRDQFAFIANGARGLLSLETGIQVQTETLGQSGAPVTAWNVDKSGNYAYLAAGERGLRVLDVTDPNRPNDVAFLDTAGGSISVDVAGNIAYIADGNNGLVIANVSNRSGILPILKQIPSPDARDVTVNNSYAYIADYQDGLVIVSAAQPESASIVKIMDQPGGVVIKPTGVSVMGDYAYLANGSNGVAVVNILDKNIPTIVQQAGTPGQSDARSVAVLSYLPPEFQTPDVDPYNADPRNPSTMIYTYVANGAYGLQLLEFSDPRQTPAVQISLNDAIKTIPGFAVDVSISRDRTYVAYDGLGIAILNTSNPAVPELVGFFNFTPPENRVAGLFADGSQVYLAQLNNGMQVLDASVTSSPEIIGKYSAPSSVQNMAVQGSHAFTVDGERGLWVFDISDPKFPQEIAFLSVPKAKGVFVQNDYAYVAAGENGLRIVNISDPRNPSNEGGLDTAGIAQSVLVINRPDLSPPRKFAFISDGANGLVVVDVTTPAMPVVASSLIQVGNAFRLTDNGIDYLYLAAEQDGLVAVNVSDPTNPSLGDRKQAGPTTRGVAVVQSQYAYTATGDNGLVVYDASFPLAFTPVEINNPSQGEWLENVSISFTNPVPGTITSTATTAPNFAFLAEREIGMRIMDTTNPRKPLLSGEWQAEISSPDLATAQIPPQVVQIVSEWIPPVVEGADPGYFRMFVADSMHGFTIVDGTKETRIKLLDTFETKGSPVIAGFIESVRAKAQGNLDPSEKYDQAMRQFMLDFALFGIVGFFCWLGFVALFVLPINHFSDWENLYNRLYFYLFGRHGAAARVRGGKLVGPVDEIARSGPGVFLVDASSAIILEKRVLIGSRAGTLPLIRVASSNVVFAGNQVFLTRPAFDEFLRGTADLRPQVRLSTGVNGYTRDGIEVETIIFTIFTLGESAEVVRVAYVPPRTAQGEDEPPPIYQPLASDLRVVTIRRNHNGSLQIVSITDELDEEDKREIHQFCLTDPRLHVMTIRDELRIRQPNPNGAPFVVDPVRTFQAIFAQADDLPENKQLDWTDLPNLIAIERFRNMIAGEAYDNLYNPLGRQEVYPISDMKANMRSWVRNQGILSVQYIRKLNTQPLLKGEILQEGELFGSDIAPLNNPKILRVRGIKVKFAGFTELTPTNPDVRRQFFDLWQAKREMDADFVMSNYEIRALRERNEWRIEAQQEILNELVGILDANPHASEALAVHVLQALETAASDPDTSLLMPEDTIEMLRNLRNWLIRP